MAGVLRPEDIAALIAGVESGAISPSTAASGASIRKVDLVAGDERITRGRLPTIELIGERFARTFRVTLSKLLGRSCMIHPQPVEQLKFGAFVKRLPMPSSMHLFRMSPLPAQAIVVVSTPLVYTFVDILFGGSGIRKPKPAGAEFTAIETRLIGKVLNAALDDFADSWSSVAPIQCIYGRSEFNPLAVSIVPSTDLVVELSLGVEIEGTRAPISFCLPWNTLNPIRDKLAASFHASEIEPDAAARRRMQTHVAQSSPEMQVILARGQVKVREMVKLKVGDVLQLDTRADAPAEIRIGGSVKYKGVDGSSRGRHSVKITELPGAQGKPDSPLR